MRKILLSLFLPSLLQAQSLKEIYTNNEAVHQLEKQDLNKAQFELMQILPDHLDNPILLYNLAQIYHAQNLKPNEEKIYADLIRDILPKLEKQPHYEERVKLFKFKVLFNYAGLLAEGDKKEEAVAIYQQALDLFPESLEAKHNIELLTQEGEGGGGGGDDKKKQEQKDKKDDQKKDQKDKDKSDEKKDNQESKPQEQKAKPTPRPFDSKDLSQQDVKKILDELKRQEAAIRAKINEKNPKENNLGKDW